MDYKTTFDTQNKQGTTKNQKQELEQKRKPQWFKSAFPLAFDGAAIVGAGSSKEQRQFTTEDEASEADMGYGKMTKGEYNACGGKGTYKTFGSTGQG